MTANVLDSIVADPHIQQKVSVLSLSQPGSHKKVFLDSLVATAAFELNKLLNQFKYCMPADRWEICRHWSPQSPTEHLNITEYKDKYIMPFTTESGNTQV